MTFSYRIPPRIPPEFRFHVFRIRFPRTLFSALTFPPILGGSPPLPPLFPRFPPQERRTSDVAVTNYLGLHQRDGEKERERSPPRPPLVDPSPPLAASPRGISPLLLHSPLFFPSARHFCGAKRDTYMDFVTGVRFAAQGIPLYAGPLFCTG